MKRNVALEAHIVQGILRHLRQLPGLIVRKRHGSVMGIAGDPDLYGSFNGRHFELEVKRPELSSELTELQRARMEQWRRAGAVVGVARSAEEALSILLPPKRGAGQVAVAFARDLVERGTIDEGAQDAVANAITTAIIAYGSQGGPR
ncbi:MAG: hypothetical protein KIT09_28065 [Bryobacteraceae bacterium]|nr:hypothetical protein [Bryobacteraceae bacterium]